MIVFCFNNNSFSQNHTPKPKLICIQVKKKKALKAYRVDKMHIVDCFSKYPLDTSQHRKLIASEQTTSLAGGFNWFDFEIVTLLDAYIFHDSIRHS